MVINRPMLPPKKGYVEVEVDGKRTYKNVDTGLLIDEEVETNEGEYATYEELAEAIREGVNSV